MPALRLAAVIGILGFANMLAADTKKMVAGGSSDASTQFTLGTDDTSITIEARGGTLAVTSLKSPVGFEWLDGATNILPLVAAAEVDGATVPLVWRFKAASEEGTSPKRVEFVFSCDHPALELKSVWQAFPGPGPVEHFLTIANRGTSPVFLPLQKSLELQLSAPEGHGLDHLWVERGGAIPSNWGTHWTAVAPGYSSSLASGITRPFSNDPTIMNDPMPWTTLLDRQGCQGVYFGVEFSGMVRLALEAESATSVKIALGLGQNDKEDEEFRTRLVPGGAFQAAPVLVGCYRGDEDDGANRLRRWIESYLRPCAPGYDLPLLVNNSWGSGMAVDDKMSRSMIDVSARMGLELFGLDAGWFRGVGDWHEDTRKFPHGLGAIADYARSQNLRFGLWIGWVQGGTAKNEPGQSTALSVVDEQMKGWFTKDYAAGWKPKEFTGADVCLGDPRAVQWCLNDLRRCVKEYKLDMLEHDQTMIVVECKRADHAHTASRIDTSYHAALGYYGVYDTLRAENPGLLLENCVNGGHMVDFGVLRRTHYTCLTDHYDPLSNRRAFYDSVYFLPPSMAECYVGSHPGKTIGNFLHMLRSGMMGWCTIMLDMAKWTPEQAAAGKRQFGLYKEKLRPLINTADLYHVSQRPDGANWDGMEYFNPQTGKGVLFAFRGNSPDQPEHVFKLKGLDPCALYLLTFEDGTAKPTEMSGADLMAQGLSVHLPEAETSELVWMERK